MKRKNIIQRLIMPLPELEDYYRERRQERFEQNAPFRGIKIRKVLHPLALGLLKVTALLSYQGVTIIADRRIPTDRPVIFVSTHIGWNDPAVVFLAIHDQAYLFWGDPKYSYKTIDGFFMDLNGTIICHTGSKSDRYIGKETCIQCLNQGGNLLIFPEGAWNVTPNLPIMPLFNGTAEMAIRSGAEIVPVAIERDGRNYTVNIGRNISSDGFSLNQKADLTQTIRDALATLKWEIWESQQIESRADIPADYGKHFLQEILDQIRDDSYSLEDIEITRFHTKAELERKDVESHLGRLIPSMENAFLLRR